MKKSTNIKKKKKILFLLRYNNINYAPTRVRVLQFLPYLEKNGLDYKLEELPYGNLIDKIRFYLKNKNRLENCDVIFITRKVLSPIEIKYLKSFKKKLIFDFDDATYLKDDGTISLSRKIRFQYFLKNLDLVIAGNKYLANDVIKYNQNVIVLPSVVKTEGIPVKDYSSVEVNNKIKIGWIGTKDNLKSHIPPIADILKKLASEYNIEFRIICDTSLKIEGVNVKFIPWGLETQEKEIAKLDIGIMPLVNNPITWRKCGYKLLQYMAAGIPSIASAIGVNKEIIDHGVNGFLANDFYEFYKYFKILIENPQLRKEMGLKAREKVKKFYSLEKFGEKFVKILENILKNV